MRRSTRLVAASLAAAVLVGLFPAAASAQAPVAGVVLYEVWEALELRGQIKTADPEAFRRASDARTRAYYAETLPNPKLAVFPIAEVARIGKSLGIPLIMDNTSAPVICALCSRSWCRWRCQALFPASSSPSCRLSAPI